MLSGCGETRPDCRRARVVEPEKRLNVNFNRFKNVQQLAVKLPEGELVAVELLSAGHTLPLVIPPAVDGLDLADWASGSLPFIEDRLLKYGALLFRDFDINTSSAFERFARTVCTELMVENGEHPRTSVSRQDLYAGLLPAGQTTPLA